MARILVAEDDAHIIRIMSLWLRQHGHEVIETRNGADALKQLETESVDVIITDMNMPILDGCGLATGVRQQLKLDTPILMLSSRCDQFELRERTRPLGVTLYPKPFVPSRLVLEIDRLLAGDSAGQLEQSLT